MDQPTPQRQVLLNGGRLRAHPRGIAEIATLFNGCSRVAVIPYAEVRHVDETDEAHDLALISRDVVALSREVIGGVSFVDTHTASDPRQVLEEADGIWVPGGNTFHLAHWVHRLGLVAVVRERVNRGIPYAGASAGAVIAGPRIITSNDWQIIDTPLDGFALVPFLINPHSTPRISHSGSGETTEQRIAEVHALHGVVVVGVPDGMWLRVDGGRMWPDGRPPRRRWSPRRSAHGGSVTVFEPGRPAYRVEHGTDMARLLDHVPQFQRDEPGHWPKGPGPAPPLGANPPQAGGRRPDRSGLALCSAFG